MVLLSIGASAHCANCLMGQQRFHVPGTLEGVMNLLKNDLLMRKTGDRRRTELTEESASQCGLSAEFITPSRSPCANRSNSGPETVDLREGSGLPGPRVGVVPA